MTYNNQEQEEIIQPGDFQQFESRIGAAVEQGRPWVYRDVQNPAWMNWIMAATIAVFIIGAVATSSESKWISLMMAFFAALSLILFGGLRTTINAEKVQVRLGIFELPVLTLKTEEIQSFDIHQFSPLADFGGYGIRFNREMKAYYFRGNRGVKLTSTYGKQYLIGSDNPEALAEVIRIARRMVGR